MLNVSLMNTKPTKRTVYNNTTNKDRPKYQTKAASVSKNVAFGDLGFLTAMTLMFSDRFKASQPLGGSFGLPENPVKTMQIELLKLQTRVCEKMLALSSVEERKDFKFNDRFDKFIQDKEFIEAGGLEKLSRAPLAVKVRKIMEESGWDRTLLQKIVVELEHEGRY